MEIKNKIKETEKNEKNDLCPRCKKEKAEINYSSDVMSFAHGFVEKICRKCYITILEKNFYAVQKELNEQRKLYGQAKAKERGKECLNKAKLRVGGKHGGNKPKT